MNESILIEKILRLGYSIAEEKNYNKLFGIFINGVVDIANCDGGTLYQYKADSNGEYKLFFRSTLIKSKNSFFGLKGEDVPIPPVNFVETNASSYSGIHRVILNVPDVYKETGQIWLGPKSYDQIIGYHTQSVLVVPLIDKNDDLIGVLQLINAMDDEGNIIPFDSEIENVIHSLSSQLAMILSNMLLNEEIEHLLNTMVDSFVETIESRTPYNALHTRNVKNLCEIFINYLGEKNGKPIISKDDKDAFLMAARLHDVGKMIIPEETLNKPTKLDKKIDAIKSRFQIISLEVKLDNLEGKITDYEAKIKFLNDSLELVEKVNTMGFVDDETIEKIKAINTNSFYGSLLTDEELEDLLIRKGTLNLEERKTVENHVVFTKKILDKISFGSKKYKNVIDYASKHHEYLDGSGYPNHLKDDELSMEVRILTMMDVFESLTASDRPYKKEMETEKAYSILQSMAAEGKLDSKYVEIFGELIKQNLIRKNGDKLWERI